MPAALTQRAVEAAKPHPAKRLEIPDAALPGFYLVVQPSGAKSWAVRYRAAGKSKKLTLGPYPRLTLGEARDQARVALRTVSEGRDPAGERQGLKQAAEVATKLRFGVVAADFVERYAKPRNRTWKETERLLTKGDLAGWQDKDIRTIGRRDILDALDAIVERDAPILANRVFAALRRLFGWGVERGILDASPMNGLKPVSPETSRDRVLTDVEVSAIWRAAEEIGEPFGPAVRLLILTGQRRSEVLGAQWPEFVLHEKGWTIPRERAKNDSAHFVPLSTVASDLVEGLNRIGDPPRFLFTTTGDSPFAGVTKAMERLRKLSAAHTADKKPVPAWRIHDLRRTYASGCARLGIPVHVVEKALNHTSGTFGGIVGVYQRHEFLDERRRAMDAWAGHVMGLLREQPSNVRPIRARVGA